MDSFEANLPENLAKRDEAFTILDAGAVNFEGYAARLHGDAGLRSIYTVDCEAIDAFNAGEQSAKITEIGAIVAIKGEREIDDLTVALGAQMSKHAVYEDGTWKDNLSGENGGLGYLYTNEAEGTTTFALTTVFDTESVRTKDCYETELLYRGYAVVTVGEFTYVYYLDMTAPNVQNVSMYALAKALVEKDASYADYATIAGIIETCEQTAE